MNAQARAIEAGDYVRVAPTTDMWRVVTVDGSRALLSPSSITLAGRPRRTVEVGQLRVVRGHALEDDVF